MTRAAATVVLVIAAIAAPLLLSAFWIAMLSLSIVFAILASGINLIGGYSSMVSLGHAGIMAVAGYGVAYTAVVQQGGFLAQVSVGLAVGLLCSLLFGLLSVRADGIYFLLVTLALGMIVWGLALRLHSITGGDNGIRGVSRPSLIAEPSRFYFGCLAVLSIMLALKWLIIRSPLGLALRGLLFGERRLITLGYSLIRVKVVGFVLSGLFASIAGILLVYYNRFMSPETANFFTSGKALLMVILGGAGTLIGPLVGSTLVTVTENYVSLHVSRWPTVLGLMFIFGVLFAPGGVVRIGEIALLRVSHRARAGEYREEAPMSNAGRS